MIRFVFGLLIVVGITILGTPAQGQRRVAEENAERAELREQLDRLILDYQALKDTQEVIRAQIRKLREDLGESGALAQEEPGESAPEYATRDDLLALDQRITTLEEKWNKELKDLGSQISGLKDMIRDSLAKTQAGSGSGEFYEHTIQRGETVNAIVRAFQEEGVNVTVDQVLAANPGLDPNKISLGTVIRIPAE